MGLILLLRMILVVELEVVELKNQCRKILSASMLEFKSEEKEKKLHKKLAVGGDASGTATPSPVTVLYIGNQRPSSIQTIHSIKGWFLLLALNSCGFLLFWLGTLWGSAKPRPWRYFCLKCFLAPLELYVLGSVASGFS
ncbi:hypothetical protein VNO80_20156 [Phaseolus coccineus]|uniref:Uncharacterized protein n=1 Tax=Phaseolus coccineus TaxID=3886 RepID=A0AAN9MHG2_PHACN